MKSKPLKEGKMKSNLKSFIKGGRQASPPPPINIKKKKY